MAQQGSKVLKVVGIPYTANYAWSVGVPMEKFIKSLKDKQLLASKCPNCGYVYAPPRNRCGKCNSEIGEGDIIKLSGKGSLVGYTTGHVELDGAGNWKDLKKPQVIGAVKLEGADSTVFVPLEVADPKKLKTGMAVKVKWAKEPKGEIKDIECFQTA